MKKMLLMPMVGLVVGCGVQPTRTADEVRLDLLRQITETLEGRVEKAGTENYATPIGDCLTVEYTWCMHDVIPPLSEEEGDALCALHAIVTCAPGAAHTKIKGD